MATPVRATPGWHFGVFDVDTVRGELRRSGIPLKLREQSFQVLLTLLEKPNEIVTREELRHRLWPSDTFVDFDHGLNTAMMKLRDALGDSAEAPIYIETIPRHGYRFLAPVSPISEWPRPSLEASAAPPPPPAEQTTPSAQHLVHTLTNLHNRRIGLMIGAIGVFALLATTILVFERMRSSPAHHSPPSYRTDSVTDFRGSVKDPALTPDGRDVAFAWNGGEGDHWDVYVQRIGSPLPMRLTYIKTGLVGYPAWSPDQSQIAFTRCDGIHDGVYVVPALGGPERKLASASCQYNMPFRVAWLTNARMLMIDRCPASGVHGLALLSLDTGEKRCIADFGSDVVDRRFQYSVSPDGKSVVFTPAWEQIPCELYTMSVTGGSLHRIVQDPSRCDDVMWSADGASIVFLSERTKFFSLWRVPATGGRLQAETVYPAMGSHSRDGRRFVFAEQSNGEPPSVWRADVASPGGKVLINAKLIASQFPELDAQPSADGARLVWASRRALIEEVWTSDSDGENRLQLTHLNAYSGTPRWSPDGKWIVFDSDSPDGAQIYVMDVEGRNLRQITQGPYQNIVPSWSHDGKWIYYASKRSGTKEVWKHSLETGEEIQLTTHGGFNPFESFDGKTVYFSKFDEAGIWSVPSNGGKETVVIERRPQVFYWGHWALTRPGIYFLDADAEPRARVDFYNFATRRISPVFFIEKNVPFGQPSLSATPNGKTIYYTQSDRQSVIKMIEFR